MEDTSVRKRVLVADDEVFMRDELRKIIGKAGYDVAEATHCSGAVEGFKLVCPDIVVLDMTIQGGGGLEALRRIRECDPNAKIVVLGMVGQKPTMVEACESGANHYILKPFNTPESVDQVVDTLQRVLADEYAPGYKQSFLGQPRGV